MKTKQNISFIAHNFIDFLILMMSMAMAMATALNVKSVNCSSIVQTNG